jgi:hypothetical protein
MMHKSPIYRNKYKYICFIGIKQEKTGTLSYCTYSFNTPTSI